jgi:hypothetical protein
VKELLSRAGHTWISKNVEEDDGAYTELIGLGFTSVPVTIIGRHAVKGYDEAQLREAIAASGS